MAEAAPDGFLSPDAFAEESAGTAVPASWRVPTTEVTVESVDAAAPNGPASTIASIIIRVRVENDW
jgi:hypothetical protein